MSSRDIVIGIDPGGTTGFATYDITDDLFISWEVGEKQILMDLSTVIDTALRRGRYPCLAVEKFIVGMNTARKRRATTPIDIGANILSFAVHRLGTEFMHITPTASEAKRFTNEHLRHIGWYHIHGSHANDAARHVLFMLVKRHPDVIDKLFADYKI